MKYTHLLLLLLTACTKSYDGPAYSIQPPQQVSLTYGADNFEKVKNWATSTGEDLHVMPDQYSVILVWYPRRHLGEERTFRKDYAQPLVKDLYLKKAIDHMELMAMSPDSANYYDYLFTKEDFK